MSKRVLIAAFAAAATVAGTALLPASPEIHTAQQPWDPGCWGPFAWGSGTCDWSPGMDGSTTNGPWDPSVTGPGQFNRGGTGSGTNS